MSAFSLQLRFFEVRSGDGTPSIFQRDLPTIGLTIFVPTPNDALCPTNRASLELSPATTIKDQTNVNICFRMQFFFATFSVVLEKAMAGPTNSEARGRMEMPPFLCRLPDKLLPRFQVGISLANEGGMVQIFSGGVTFCKP